MPQMLPPTVDRFSRFAGKMCLVTSSGGQTKVGLCTGLMNLGTKDCVEFTTTSGHAMLVNVSYLETLEVLDCENQVVHDYRGQAGRMVECKA